jgi:hypothetical protein
MGIARRLALSAQLQCPRTHSLRERVVQRNGRQFCVAYRAVKTTNGSREAQRDSPVRWSKGAFLPANRLTIVAADGRLSVVGFRALQEYCLCEGLFVGMSFPPGSSYTYVLKVPVTEVLGDSLPAGRYRVIAQLRLNGFLTRRFSAGDVQLAAPRHLTNVAADGRRQGTYQIGSWAWCRVRGGGSTTPQKVQTT